MVYAIDYSTAVGIAHINKKSARFNSAISSDGASCRIDSFENVILHTDNSKFLLPPVRTASKTARHNVDNEKTIWNYINDKITII